MIKLHQLISDWLKEGNFNFEVVPSAFSDVWFIRRIGQKYNANYEAVVHIYDDHWPGHTYVVCWKHSLKGYGYDCETLDPRSPEMFTKLGEHLDETEVMYWAKYPDTIPAIAGDGVWHRLRRGARILFELLTRSLSLVRLHPSDTQETKFYHHLKKNLSSASIRHHHCH